MPNVVFEEKDSLNAQLVINIPKSDYQPEIKKKIRDLRKKVNMPGFRAGKTPASLIRKMYGKQVLGETINDLLDKEVRKFLEEKDLDMVGQPIPADDQESYDFDIKQLSDYQFKFDIGLAPEFELEGFSAETTLPFYKIGVTEEDIDKAIAENLEKLAESRATEEPIEEKDLLKVSLWELEAEETVVKEGGIEANTSVSVDLIGDEAVAQAIIGKGVGHAFQINIADLDKNQDEAGIRKYILDIDEETEFNSQFQVEVTEVMRLQNAEINEEFFGKLFPDGSVTTEEELRAKIKEDYQAGYGRQSDAFFAAQVREHLQETHSLELPKAFLKRWLKLSNEELTDERIEKEFDFFERDLSWQLIQNKISTKFDIKVSEEDVKANLKEQIAGYFGGSGMAGMDDSFLDSMVERTRNDEKMWREQVDKAFADKMNAVLVKEMGKEEKELSQDEFGDTVKAFQEKINTKLGIEPEEEADEFEEATIEEVTIEEVEVENVEVEEKATEE